MSIHKIHSNGETEKYQYFLDEKKCLIWSYGYRNSGMGINAQLFVSKTR